MTAHWCWYWPHITDTHHNNQKWTRRQCDHWVLVFYVLYYAKNATKYKINSMYNYYCGIHKFCLHPSIVHSFCIHCAWWYGWSDWSIMPNSSVVLLFITPLSTFFTTFYLHHESSILFIFNWKYHLSYLYIFTFF